MGTFETFILAVFGCLRPTVSSGTVASRFLGRGLQQLTDDAACFDGNLVHSPLRIWDCLFHLGHGSVLPHCGPGLFPFISPSKETVAGTAGGHRHHAGRTLGRRSIDRLCRSF